MSYLYAGTKTEENLWTALAAEAVARSKYTYFASVAKKEGFEQIAEFFLKTAENEKEHGKLWARRLCLIGDTPENLLNAAEAEHEEWTAIYTNMAKTALEEGFEDLAQTFLSVAKIEEEHEARFRALLKNIDTNEVFAKTGISIWECRNCGHIEIASEAPCVCPVCNHPQAFFELKSKNY